MEEYASTQYYQISTATNFVLIQLPLTIVKNFSTNTHVVTERPFTNIVKDDKQTNPTNPSINHHTSQSSLLHTTNSRLTVDTLKTTQPSETVHLSLSNTLEILSISLITTLHDKTVKRGVFAQSSTLISPTTNLLISSPSLYLTTF